MLRLHHIEEARLTRNSTFIGRVRHHFTCCYDGNQLISVKGRIYFSEHDAFIAEGNLGDTYFPFDINATLSDPTIFIHDFVIPLKLRSLGVARYGWHRLYCLLPDDLLSRTQVAGKLVEQDNSSENSARRNQLWSDLCGASVMASSSKFQHQVGVANGSFSGPLHNPWDPNRSRLEIELLPVPES
ncbi:MAG: hypothetical protein ABL902_08795 [Gallionella sp.]